MQSPTEILERIRYSVLNKMDMIIEYLTNYGDTRRIRIIALGLFEYKRKKNKRTNPIPYWEKYMAVVEYTGSDEGWSEYKSLKVNNIKSVTVVFYYQINIFNIIIGYRNASIDKDSFFETPPRLDSWPGVFTYQPQ